MRVATAWACNFADYSRGRLLEDVAPQQIVGGAAAVCVAVVCAWTICINVGGVLPGNDEAARTDMLPFAARRADRHTVIPLPEQTLPTNEVAAFDSRFSAAFPPGVFSSSVPIASGQWSMTVPPPTLASTQAPPRQADRRVAENTPAVRPGWHLHSSQPSREGNLPTQTAAADTWSPPADPPGLFERIFGGQPHSIFAKLFGSSPSGATLAYANTESGVARDSGALTAGLYDRQTAVYDISAHMVYMPDGRALEAHSGLGSMLDDPRYVSARDRGATPPDVYDLKPREALFHGVAALRLIPVDETKVYGRSGLLAHTYMLGPNGQSNGCVSFKDYDAFLRAYENHEITRLAVVSHID